MSIPRRSWDVRPSAFQAAVFLAAQLLGVLLLGSRLARAQAPSAPPANEPPLRVIWISDDPQCDGGDVAARALRQVSPGVVPRPLKAMVEVQREGEGWLVRLQTESADQSGRRILRAESCKELEQAIALLLAMTLESKGEPPAALPEPPATPPASPRPPGPNADGADGPDELPPPPPPPSPGLTLGAFARATGKVGWGLQPGTAFGVGANIGASFGDIDVGIDAAYWPGTRETVPDQGSVVVVRYDVGLRACWNVWRAGDLVVAPCLGPGLTYYRYDTEDISSVNEDPDYPLLVNVTGGVDVRYAPFGPHVSLVLGGGLTWEKVQPFRTAIDDPAMPDDDQPAEPAYVEIYRTKGLGPRLELGVDARF
jgi:hypothetical protein